MTMEMSWPKLRKWGGGWEWVVYVISNGFFTWLCTTQLYTIPWIHSSRTRYDMNVFLISFRDFPVHHHVAAY